MLAINKILTYALGMIGCFTICVSASFVSGQQPQQPSQRYAPVRSVPPSVHVPTNNARPIQGSGNTVRQADASQFRDSAVRQTSYSFSDRDLKVPNLMKGDKSLLPNNQVVESMRNHMKQMGHEGLVQNPPQNLPNSPRALNSGQPSSRNLSTMPQVDQGQFQPGAGRVTSDFSKQTGAASQFKAAQLPSRSELMGSPRVAPEEIDLTPPTVQKPQLFNTDLRGATNQARNLDNFANPMRGDSAQNVSTQLPAESTRQDGDFAARNASGNQTAAGNSAAKPETQESIASEPIRKPETNLNQAAQMPRQDVYGPSETSPQPKQANFEQMQVPQNQVRTVANEAPIRQKPELSLRAPEIQVDAYGPRKLGVNKTGTYKVVVYNQSNFAAEDINVGISLPSWIDIRNVNLSSGTRTEQNTDGSHKLVWNVQSIPANSSQSMTIDAVPTQAKMFDVGIEWAMVPKAASTNIDVTEPRLAMKISGPEVVQFGEKAIYLVTVKNPGTGTAENVLVKLPQELGGEQAKLHDILPGKEKQFQVELYARTAGKLDLATSASADGNIETAAGKQISVKRAVLDINIQGPPQKYAGTVGYYTIKVSNTGDATATDVIAAVALPNGVKYLGGIESVENEENRIRWKVGTLDEGEELTYKIKCVLNADGILRLDAGVRGSGDLAAAHGVDTRVETVADLVLTVADPKGPLPTGEETEYTIRVTNRGTRAAKAINLVMQFSKGIEPRKADGAGLTHKIMTGQVLFSPIEQIEPGQEVELTVTAIADVAGTHIFRAQLVCEESDAREVAEGTTRFFGEPVRSTASSQNGFQPTDENQFKR